MFYVIDCWNQFVETAPPGPGKEAMKGIQALLEAKPVKIRGQDENVFFTHTSSTALRHGFDQKNNALSFPNQKEKQGTML